MRQSQLFTHSLKELPKDEASFNAQTLMRAGFIEKISAGVYAYLPLGLRVFQKIEAIIRQEMANLGAQEVELPSLTPEEPWQQTGRLTAFDILFKTAGSDKKQYILAPTHEEIITPLVKKFVQSYRDLPLGVYQIQTKFRNELRVKSGLLRGREFTMKDLYSFDKTKEDHESYYERAKQAYIKIWDRLGIGNDTYVTFASGGSFSKFSHEFQTVCDSGEDTVYLERKKRIAINKEVYNDDVIKELGIDKNDLEEVRAIEVGNIFPLGTKFSDALGLYYTDEQGNKKPVIMGSYGIGPGRVMATIVELKHDDNGIIWPENISPYKVSLVGLNLEEESVSEQAESVYRSLISAGIDVLYDDRKDTTAGQKFSDMDLIGIPYRAVVSQKTGDGIELKKRSEKESKVVNINQLIDILKN